MLAQMFMMSMNSLNVFVGGIIGTQLAPSEKLATLPVASIIVGTAMATVPVAMLMRRLGRKRTFLWIAVYSIFVAGLASYAITIQSFYLFTFCTFLLGANAASIMQFRFASMESVDADLMPKAASYVLIGGIAAAFLGPETALLGRDLLTVEFAGSFLLLAGLFVIGAGILALYQNTEATNGTSSEEPRKLTEIVSQRTFWLALMAATIGYAVMSFIMTATPVSMHVMDGHSLNHTKMVIQSHIVAMFLPSLITGFLIKRFGIIKIMVAGLAAYFICISFAFTGHNIHNYWLALVLLGVGWNFLFVSGTALLPQTYKDSERFKVQAFNEFFLFTSQAIAALSAGWVVFEFGWELLLGMSIPFIVLQLGLVIWWLYKRNQEMRTAA